jgi:mono/diheme cytochrome c family protein
MRKIGIAVVAVGLLALVAGPAISAEDGAALYKAKCAMCHGENGVAKKMAEPSRNLNDPKFQEAVSKDEIVKVLTEGRGKKKSMKDKLSAEQMAAVAAHVKTLK